MGNFARNHFASTMTTGYILFSSLAVVGRIAKPFLGELGDILSMGVVLWPYPLMLALQTWIPLGSLFWVFFVGGLFVTIAFGFFLQRRFPALSKGSRWSYASALVLWSVPLVIIEVAVIAVVWVMGLPIGE